MAHRHKGTKAQRKEEANTGYLKHGKLVARVEGKDAEGFTVETPNAQIEDLGTEFGVEVVKDHFSQVDVFKGKVVVESSGDGPHRSVRLVRGESVRFLADGVMGKKGSANRTRFVAELPLLRFFTDRSKWLAVVTEMEHLRLDATGVALAEEVDSPPKVDQNVGPSLTFHAAATGLSRNFRLKMLQPESGVGHGFVFSDTMGMTTYPAFTDALSVGDIESYEDDDWEVAVPDDSGATAMAVVVRHNDHVAGESLSVYGRGGRLLGRFTTIPPMDDNKETFLGVVSNTPLSRIVFDEDPTSDDIALSDVLFARRRSETDEKDNKKSN